MTPLISTLAALPLILAALAVTLAYLFRRVVPTNMVHIVQSSARTTPYGRGKAAGNTYYAWPTWVPKIGVSVIEFPESIFQVNLSDYESYDRARLPFVVDVTAFFRVEQAETAAQRVENFDELLTQLTSVVQGAVRRVLATNELEEILQSRSDLGDQFTNEVRQQIAEWGVLPVKTIEFMDIRDSSKGEVIKNIMDKEKSRIEKESRVAIATNHQAAQLAEIDAARTVDVQRQDAEQQVGLRTAEKEKLVGIATEQSHQEVQEQARVTAEKNMAVQKVEREREAEIEKAVRVTQAEADKQAQVLEAEASLQATLKEAEGIRAKGEATARAEEALLMAPVSAQLTLAKEIGSNSEYQTYLITIEQVKAGQAVGVEMAQAIAKADLQVIANGGGQGEIAGGVTNLMDMFSTKGGTSLTGMLSALSQTDAGKQLVKRIAGGTTE